MGWTNWGRNQRASPVVAAPASVEELQEVVASVSDRGGSVKAIGAGHSFSAIAVPEDVQLSLSHISGLLSVDSVRRHATFAAGTTLNEIAKLLAPHGLAMENLGDIDHQTIAGAISTGTHGSGARFGGLATQVVALAMVTATGELLRIDADTDPELLEGVAVGLGALGVLVEVTLRCVPAFPLHAEERNEPFEDLLGGLPERASLVDHLDMYWFPHTSRILVKTNTRLAPGSAITPPSRIRQWWDDELLGNTVFGLLCRIGSAAPDLIPRINRLASGTIAQRGYSDHSHRVFVANRNVRFVEQEYALPAENVTEAMQRIRSLIERRGWRISFPVELRFSAADRLWMSTAYGRASGYIAVHRYVGEPYEEYFAAVEEICVALGGRPHWGKLHTQKADSLRLGYERFGDFVALRDRLDPDRTFRNSYLDGVLGS
ncbi:FAD-linked oxidoreductase [Amnibacterium flavum]|uniref:FAD-linked oxidoreductase n=1 Tax=Amnibacterium flavum TaxID=2173173 RepID=A0A2V1HQM0_9MICO|nr:FAD-linked oxidoreductase [Amnibacterium flavum]